MILAMLETEVDGDMFVAPLRMTFETFMIAIPSSS
jgi:hypothetical protein